MWVLGLGRSKNYDSTSTFSRLSILETYFQVFFYNTGSQKTATTNPRTCYVQLSLCHLRNLSDRSEQLAKYQAHTHGVTLTSCLEFYNEDQNGRKSHISRDDDSQKLKRCKTHCKVEWGERTGVGGQWYTSRRRLPTQDDGPAKRGRKRHATDQRLDWPSDSFQYSELRATYFRQQENQPRKLRHGSPDKDTARRCYWCRQLGTQAAAPAAPSPREAP